MASLKFKEGDIVIVCWCNHGHGFEIGDSVEIKEVCDDDYYATNGKRSWWVCDDELVETGINVLG